MPKRPRSPIMDAKRFEEALKRSYGFMVETARDVVMTVDNRDRILFANPAVTQLTGYTPLELVGQKITQLIPQHKRPQRGKPGPGAVKVKKSVSESDVSRGTIVHKEGRDIAVDISMRKFTIAGKGMVAAVIRDATTRNGFQNAGRENEERLRWALSAGKMGVWDWDIRNDTITWHREVLEALGMEVAIVQSGKARLEKIHPDDRVRLQETVSRAIREKREYFVEYRVKLPDQTTRWVEERGMGAYDETGECVAVRGLISDATHRKQVEEKLSESERRYRNVVESQPDLICRFLPDTTLTFVNDAYCRYFGKKREQLLGTRFLELIPTALHAKVMNHIQTLLELPSGKGQHEHQVIGPNRERRWMLWTNCVTSTDKDDDVEIQGLGRDITENRRLQEDLSRREREFATLVENSPDIISRLDRNLRFSYISPTVKSVFGISAQHFIGKRTREVGVHSHDWRGFDSACQRVFATGKPEYREFFYGERYFRTRIIPEFADAGTVESVMCIDQDVSEQKRTELELRSLSTRLLDMQDKERRRIARELHDGTAQNLFAMSIGLSRVLQQSLVPDFKGTLEECLALCEQSRQEIRTLSYLLHPPMLDEAGLVSALKWYIEGFSERSGIRVDLISEPDPGRLPMEIETVLFRIVQECLANIHRHSGSSLASVKLERNSDKLMLQVQDWGRGIPSEAARAGVGIPGMRERLSQLLGHLEIESNGQGTTVTATVPLAAERTSGLLYDVAKQGHSRVR